jgi:hypothetical protein
MLTSLLANDDATAIYPQYLPISLTIPTPISAASASTLAALMNWTASSQAVWKPNDLSMNGISLSTVLGTPTMLMFTFWDLSSF